MIYFALIPMMKCNQALRLLNFFQAQLSTKFQLLRITKDPQIKKFLAFNLSHVVFIMLINVKIKFLNVKFILLRIPTIYFT